MNIAPEWAKCAAAVRSLPDEAKDRLRAAPPERWLSASESLETWAPGDRSALAAVSRHAGSD